MGRRHGGKGAARSPSIRRSISANRVRLTATSASRKVTVRPWRTAFAPILTSLSRSVVSDQWSISLGSANFRYWLRLLKNYSESPKFRLLVS
jgi:hypothetical protein